MSVLLRFFAINGYYVVVYDDWRELALLVGLDGDYSVRYRNDLNPLISIINDVFELGIEEILEIDNDFKASVIQELKEQNNSYQLKKFKKLCKEVA